MIRRGGWARNKHLTGVDAALRAFREGAERAKEASVFFATVGRVHGDPTVGSGVMTRDQAASHLLISIRTLQRMEDRGELRRCPGFGMLVRYPARDVLRLASASGRKGA